MIESYMFIPWGTDPKLTDAFPASLATSPNHVQVAQSGRFRIDPEGTILLANPPGTSASSYTEDLSYWSTSLPQDNGDLIDLVATRDSIILLTRHPQDGLALTAIVHITGRILWRTIVSNPLDGILHLALQDDHIYLSSALHDTPALSFTVQDGRHAHRIQRNTSYGRLYPIGATHLASLAWLPQSQKVALARISPDTTQIETTPLDPRWNNHRHATFGIDQQLNLYTYSPIPDTNQDGILKISKQSALTASFPFQDITTTPKGDKIASWAWHPQGIALTQHHPQPQTIFFALSADQTSKFKTVARTSTLLQDGTLRIDFTNDWRNYHTSLFLSPGGQATFQQLPAPQIAHQTAPRSTWQITPNGHIFIPVSTPQGTTIIRITL